MSNAPYSFFICATTAGINGNASRAARIAAEKLPADFSFSITPLNLKYSSKTARPDSAGRLAGMEGSCLSICSGLGPTGSWDQGDVLDVCTDDARKRRFMNSIIGPSQRGRRNHITAYS
jgi:hypothetical protein